MKGYATLTVYSPAQAFTEPLELAQVKTYLGLPDVLDVAGDDLLELFIAGAREQAEISQNRDLVQKQYDLILDDFAADQVPLRPHLVSVDLVRYKDSDGNTVTLVEGTDYITDTAHHPGLIMPPYNSCWPSFTPWPSSAVLIRFTCGLSSSNLFWFDAGKRVKVGMLMLISNWFTKRLPFEVGAAAIQEYPYAVTHALRQGAISRSCL